MAKQGFVILGTSNKQPTPALVYKKGKSIILENVSNPSYPRSVSFNFTKNQYFYFYSQLLEMAKEIWPGIVLKEVTSAGNDYEEYYDKELDNNGEASIDATGVSFYPPAPHLGSNRLYRFTKSKIQTYLFDLKKYVD